MNRSIRRVLDESPARKVGRSTRRVGDRPVSLTDDRVVSVRHYGRWLVSIIVVLIGIQLLYGLATNEFIRWDVVGEFLFNGSILYGLLITIGLTVISMVIGLVVAVVIAIMRLSGSMAIRGVAWIYVFIFRGIPLIVLLIIVGNIGLFVRTVTIGVPFTDIVFVSVEAQSLFSPFVASVVGLSLAGSAYMSEIVRSGILSVGSGQHLAAKALGMNPMQTMRYITLPQALRVILPPLGNEFVSMLKASALVSVIAGGDLLTVAKSIGGLNYRVIELLFVATFWYLAIITVFSLVQFFLERRHSEK